MSGIEKEVAAKLAEMLPKIVKKAAEGHAAGHRKIADYIHRAANQLDEVEQRVARDAAGLRTKAHGGVKPGESLPYREGTTRGRGIKGDRLTPDHIPSLAALVAAKQEAIWAAEVKRLGHQLNKDEKDAVRLTKAEKAAIRDEGLAIVKDEDFHRAESRTYGGRNTAERIEQDSKDLAVAVEKDFVVHLSAIEKSGGLTRQRVAEYTELYGKLIKKVS